MYCECVSAALGIQHAMRMRCIILSSAGCLVLSYFPTSSLKRRDFRGVGGKLLNTKYMF